MGKSIQNGGVVYERVSKSRRKTQHHCRMWNMQNLKRRLDEISDELLKAKYILDGITRDTQ